MRASLVVCRRGLMASCRSASVTALQHLTASLGKTSAVRELLNQFRLEPDGPFEVIAVCAARITDRQFQQFHAGNAHQALLLVAAPGYRRGLPEDLSIADDHEGQRDQGVGLGVIHRDGGLELAKLSVQAEAYLGA